MYSNIDKLLADRTDVATRRFLRFGLEAVGRRFAILSVGIFLGFGILGFGISLRAASMILHQTSFDGGLYWSCPLFGMKFSNGLQLNIAVSHVTKYNSFEDSVSSAWRLTGLETWLVCDGENKLTWHPPSGADVSFDRDLISRQEGVASKGCKLAAVSGDEYIVTDADSTQWVYERGSLAKVRFAKGGEVSFKCVNGLIREIAYGKTVIFSVQQRNSTLFLYAGDRTVAAIRYERSSQLIESIIFEDRRRPAVKFGYENNNLVSITEGDAVSYEFDWERVGFLRSYFSVLLFPCYLCSDGKYTYGHEFYFGNATMTATDAAGRRERKTLNLKSGLVTDR